MSSPTNPQAAKLADVRRYVENFLSGSPLPFSGWPINDQSGFQNTSDLVWVKVWGSCYKTFPDVPDFAQLSNPGNGNQDI
jgi:hypothetical protein